MVFNLTIECTPEEPVGLANTRMSTVIMPKNLPDHWVEDMVSSAINSWRGLADSGGGHHGPAASVKEVNEIGWNECGPHAWAPCLLHSFIDRSDFDSVHVHSKAHFTHEAESPWPSHYEHSRWWKIWSRLKFAKLLHITVGGPMEYSNLPL